MIIEELAKRGISITSQPQKKLRRQKQSENLKEDQRKYGMSWTKEPMTRFQCIGWMQTEIFVERFKS